MEQAVPVPLHRGPALWTAAAVAATVIGGTLAVEAAHPDDLLAGAGDLAVAVAFVTCGAILWADHRTGDLTGPLMVATGAAWLLGDLADGLALLHRGPLVQLLVTAPRGRPRTRTERLIVLAGYADAVVAGVADDERATVALAMLVAGTAIGRWARAGGVRRRDRAVPAVCAAAIALGLFAGAIAGAEHGAAIVWCYEAALVLTAAGLFADTRRRRAEEVVSKVVVDLGTAADGGSLTRALRRAVGDSSLLVGYVLDGGRVVDEQGSPLELPNADAERTVMSIEADGAQAVLVHDRAALQAPGLSESVAAAVRIALENVRLESQIRARVADVEASRMRLLVARDAERKVMSTRLRAGVDDRLESAGQVLSGLEECLDPLVRCLPEELDSARATLARFAAGLHPPRLEMGGLPAALGELAETAPLDVDVDAGCGRLSADVELAAWFVCSEALANAIKHSGATRVTIRAERADQWLVVAVADNGRGGAEPAAGRGLVGLAARVEAVGGKLALDEPPGAGVRLQAWLPAPERA